MNLSPPVTSTERSKAMRMLLLVNYYCCSYCLFYFCFWSLFCCAVLSVISSFAIISLGKRERDGCLNIAFNVMGLLVICVSSSLCNGLVCIV